jgi:hypothetical protein
MRCTSRRGREAGYFFSVPVLPELLELPVLPVLPLPMLPDPLFDGSVVVVLLELELPVDGDALPELSFFLVESFVVSSFALSVVEVPDPDVLPLVCASAGVTTSMRAARMANIRTMSRLLVWGTAGFERDGSAHTQGECR